MLEFLQRRRELGGFYANQAGHLRALDGYDAFRLEEIPHALQALPFKVPDIPWLNRTFPVALSLIGKEEEAAVWEIDREDFARFGYPRYLAT